jgi:hypothetical protein
MPNVIYAATRCGYRVQVIDGGDIVYEYAAGNHQTESQTFVAPRSPNAVKLQQLKRWAKQTACEIAHARGIPAQRVDFDADLEAAIREQDAMAQAEQRA